MKSRGKFEEQAALVWELLEAAGTSTLLKME